MPPARFPAANDEVMLIAANAQARSSTQRRAFEPVGLAVRIEPPPEDETVMVQSVGEAGLGFCERHGPARKTMAA